MKTYQGLLSLHNSGDSHNVLYLSSLAEPLIEELYWISQKIITVRYWITDIKVTKGQAVEGFVAELVGCGKAGFCARYSEMTGYLWTDQDLKVGGHDLLAELESYVGKWLILEIEKRGKP